MYLKEAVEDYLLYLEHEQCASINTVRSYRPSLRRLLRWMGERGHPRAQVGDLTAALARRYLYHLSELGLRPRSRLRLWIPLRSLFRMLVQQGLLTESPVEHIALPKKDPAQRRLVSDAELQLVLDRLPQITPTLTVRHTQGATPSRGLSVETAGKAELGEQKSEDQQPIQGFYPSTVPIQVTEHQSPPPLVPGSGGRSLVIVNKN